MDGQRKKERSLMSELNQRLRQSLFLLWMNTDGETLSGLYFGGEDLVLSPVPQLRKEPGRNAGVMVSTATRDSVGVEDALRGGSRPDASARHHSQRRRGFSKAAGCRCRDAVESRTPDAPRHHYFIHFPHVWDSDVFHGCQVTSSILKNKSHCVFILH